MSSSASVELNVSMNTYRHWDGGGYVEVPETWKLLTGVADKCTYNMP